MEKIQYIPKYNNNVKIYLRRSLNVIYQYIAGLETNILVYNSIVLNIYLSLPFFGDYPFYIIALKIGTEKYNKHITYILFKKNCQHFDLQ